MTVHQKKIVHAGLILAAGLLLTGLTAAPSAPTLKGIDLARACRSNEDADQALCRGFIDGFTFGSQMAVGAEFIGQWRYGAHTWCFAPGLEHTAVRDAFLAHSATYPCT
jgi:hypothetical protein